MGKFWVDDKFIRIVARNISVHTQMVYITLVCHCNKEGETYIGCRRIALNLGINKNTVSKSINELIAYGLVIRLEKYIGRASTLKVLGVPNEEIKPYRETIPKEDIKEDIKEDKNKIKTEYKGREICMTKLKKINPKAFNTLYGG